MATMSVTFGTVAAVMYALCVVAAAGLRCPSEGNCKCGGTIAVELQCTVEGQQVKISLLPDTYLIIRCENAPYIAYEKLPKLSANRVNTFKSVTFKDCPIPTTSFSDVLKNIGVSKTLSLIIQNSKNLSGYLDRKHFEGLEDLTKLLLSVNGVTNLPNNLFMDMHNLTWLNIRSNGISLTEELFRPLEKLETLEISHNHMTNISSNLFSHLSFLRKLSLWQNNVTKFSKDLFTGVDVLEELDLSSNGLNELPSSIFNPLRKLKKLTLFSNKFSSLPPNLFKNNERLDTVIIFNNDVKLQQLPRGLFGKLQNLKEVYIQRCELERIPHDVFADSPKITNLSLAYNEIEVLPEAIFNDQINLLELDLSHNKITNLEPKLFSSLVKLEKLKLCHNSLQEISGPTFSSLLSLIYLDLEDNNLKTITSYIFSNNKQRMSINMANNRLDFEDKNNMNNSWVYKGLSPFAHTYNLRLLNLSHNEFRITYDDWWLNGHDNLDISYNNISTLWSTNSSLLMDKSKTKNSKEYRPLKQIWIAHNPIPCSCQAASFLLQLQRMKTKGADINQLNCRFMQTSFCDDSDISYLLLIPFVLTINILATVATVVHRKRIYNFAKSFLEYQHDNGKHNHDVGVTYAEADEEFILQELIPGLTRHKNLKIHSRPMNDNQKKTNFIKKIRNSLKESVTNIVVFSPNYLTSVYRDINIKKIRGEMMKSKNVIYVFVDIGPENSIYAFLKEQREPRSSVIWNNPNFWNTLLDMLRETESKVIRNTFKSRNLAAKMYDKRNQYTNAFSRLTDSPSLPALNTLTHSQV